MVSGRQSGVKPYRYVFGRNLRLHERWETVRCGGSPPPSGFQQVFLQDLAGKAGHDYPDGYLPFALLECPGYKPQ